ncbi:MAG: energy-coupling factor transporter transmembrane component T [Clostridiales bacterium]|jgi:cobalt/nickel transport system permease protein|nr:energy-coupling factor transporter transmembrane protein EcfT [Eubacteriales bacterium]MDH7567612.1 energy-coupling factor transporter transmembrane component T [Clostridiales bacterium]
MPEWLLKDENYVPQGDKDTFINKSILSLLGVLSRIRAQGGYKTDRLAVNPTLKVGFTVLLVVLLSISRSFAFVIFINVYLLAALCLLKGEEILKILKTSFAVAAFTFIILLPSVFWGNYYSICMITPKVFATVTAVNMLSHSTKWNAITGAVKSFFVPDIFILVLDITIKYIFLLGEFSLNMLYSLKLRSVGKNGDKYTSLSGVAGTMFIKSKEMAEDMYSAMECRGFTGEYRRYQKIKFTFADFLYIMIHMAIIFVFIYLERA